MKGLFVLDSDLSLVSTTPKQRVVIEKACKVKKWMPLGDNKEQCALMVGKLEKYKIIKKGEPTVLKVSVNLSATQKAVLGYLQSKTSKAKECLDALMEKSVDYSTKNMTLSKTLIDEAQKDKAPIGTKVFKLFDENSITNVIMTVTRKKNSPSLPALNKNFKVSLQIFSPNDGTNRMHTIPMVGLLSPTLVTSIVKTGDINLQQFDRFGIQAIYLESTKNKDVVEAVKNIAKTTGADLLSSSAAEGFKKNDRE